MTHWYGDQPDTEPDEPKAKKLTIPVEPKVANGTLAGTFFLALTWFLVNYVFKVRTEDVASSVPGFTAVITGFLTAYVTPHQSRPEEVVAQTAQLLEQWWNDESVRESTITDAPEAHPWADPEHSVIQDLRDEQRQAQERHTAGFPAISPTELQQSDPFDR